MFHVEQSAPAGTKQRSPLAADRLHQQHGRHTPHGRGDGRHVSSLVTRLTADQLDAATSARPIFTARSSLRRKLAEYGSAGPVPLPPGNASTRVPRDGVGAAVAAWTPAAAADAGLLAWAAAEYRVARPGPPRSSLCSAVDSPFGLGAERPPSPRRWRAGWSTSSARGREYAARSGGKGARRPISPPIPARERDP